MKRIDAVQGVRGASLPLRTRREVICTFAGAAAAFGSIGAAAARAAQHAVATDAELAARAHDWDWLVGMWDVRHRRLRERLIGSQDWDEFGGNSVEWNTMAGLGTIDDNVLELPSGPYRALGIRAFDPRAREWSIWWLDGRNPERIDPPVKGRFEGDTGTFIGQDTHKGRPVTVRFRWREIHGPRPWWEQAFSTDGGATWEVNWMNYFTRMNPKPVPLAPGGPFAEQHDWNFLVGHWSVRNRRLSRAWSGAGNGKRSTARWSTGPCSAAAAMSVTTRSNCRAAPFAASACARSTQRRING